jgi:hypothetical protein
VTGLEINPRDGISIPQDGIPILRDGNGIVNFPVNGTE